LKFRGRHMFSLLISDLHLAPDRPDIVELFARFLRGPARKANALYILGDLFEAWIGDDAIDDPFNAGIADELAALTAAGVAVRFQHGNRDFLVGDGFVARTGVELLAEEVVVPLGGVPTLLMHGDQLCTDDTAYQTMRAQFRSPQWRAAVLARPLAERAALAREYRRQSAEANVRKAENLMDANADAVVDALRRHGCSRLIHGHTHRPARHPLIVDGRHCERWVLADWYTTGSCLEVDERGVEPIALS